MTARRLSKIRRVKFKFLEFTKKKKNCGILFTLLERVKNSRLINNNKKKEKNKKNRKSMLEGE